MEAFLPSEIGRLIYGYLFRQCGENLADEFLNSCDSMRECRLQKEKYAKNFHYKVQDLSLEDILNQYSVLCSLIFKNTTGDEPVHRNVLYLLRKLLSFKVGPSKTSSNQQAPSARPVVVNEKMSACFDEPERFQSTADGSITSDHVGSAHSVVVNKQMSVCCDMRENRYDSAVDEGITSNQAYSAHPVVVNDSMSACCDESENRYNSAADENIVFSPSGSDKEDDSNALVDKINDKNSLLAGSSAVAVDVPTTNVNSSDEFLRNLSSSSECRLLDQVVLSSPSAKSPVESTKKVKPFPVSESVPPRSEMISSSNAAVISLSDVLKTRNPVSATMTDEQPTVMKSIDNVSNNFLSLAECLPLTEFDCSASSMKSTSEMVGQDAILLPANNAVPRKSSVICASTVTVLPIKAPREHPIMTPKLTASGVSVSDVPMIIAPTADVTAVPPTSVAALLRTAVTVCNTTAVPSAIVPEIVVAEAPTTTALVTCATEISTTPAISVPEVLTKLAPGDGLSEIPSTTAHMIGASETSTIIESVANVKEVPTSIISAVGSVFGDLSFASECGSSAELDELTSSVKSADKPVRKENFSQASGKLTPRIVDPAIRSATKSTPRKSKITNNLSATKSTRNKSIVGIPSAAAAATLTHEITKSNSSDDELPWDLKLRLFVASDSLVDAHITKRKPKDLRNKRRKDTPKKRKYNDSCEDTLFSSDTKRFKSDAISVSVAATAAPRRKSVVSKLAEIDDDVESKSNSLKHRRRAKDSDVALDSDNKTARSKRTKSRNENKMISDRVVATKSFVSMTDIIDFGDPLVEKKKRLAVVEKKKQPMGSTKRTTGRVLQEPVSVRSIQPVVTVNDGIDSNHQVAYKKRNDLVETSVIKNGDQNIVDQKNSTFKEPNLPHPKESNVLSIKKPSSSHNNHHKRTETDECADRIKAIEMFKDQFQPLINEKHDVINESRYDDDLDFEMVLEISPEFELFHKDSQC